MKRKILISHRIPVCPVGGWEEVFELDMPDVRYSRSELLARLGDADYLVACMDRVDEELLAHAPRLRAVNSYGVGYDALDLPALARRRIHATNTPNAVTEATAEMAMALLLALARRIPAIDASMRDGTVRWGVLENTGVSLFGKTAGVVGLGRIGKAFARRARGMGMEVLYCNRNRLDPEKESALGVRHAPLAELLAQSDVVSLHTPLSQSSYHLIDADALARMKPEAFLINTARGKVVDEAALADALTRGTIAGAGLDVFEHEPHVHPTLLSSERTVLTPHAGTETPEVCRSMFRELMQGFLSLERGEIPDNLIG